MKTTSFAIGLMALTSLTPAWVAADTAKGATLSDDVQGLSLPTDVFNAEAKSQAREDMVAIQDRYSPLAGHLELGVAPGHNFTGDNFLTTNQVEVSARMHLSNRFNLGLHGATVFNESTSAAKELFQSKGVAPDFAYARRRADFMVGFNLFYGKLRPGVEQNIYFDQYIALGAGLVDKGATKGTEGVIDAGFAFWLGKWGSLRLGAKDYVLREERLSGSRLEHNVTGYVGLGVLL